MRGVNSAKALIRVAGERAAHQERRFLDATELRQIVAEEIARALAANQPRPVREGMNADEVAQFLGVDRKTVYEYANRDQIPHRKLGKRLLFSRSVLMAWLGSCKATSSPRGGM